MDDQLKTTPWHVHPRTTRAVASVFAGLFALGSIGSTGQPQMAPTTTTLLVYVGTYTGAGSRGIYVSRFNPASGELDAPRLAAETTNPSYLALHPARDFLYAVNEVGDYGGKRDGSVSAFAIDRRTGLLTFVNRQSSGGADPAHLVTDSAGAHVLVANYTGGSAAVLPIGDDGGLQPLSALVQHTGSSVHRSRQQEPHAHSINLDPAGRFTYVADLGIDRIQIYRFGADGSLAANDPPFTALAPGAGPRHFAFHPHGRFAYAINELDCTITAFRVDPARGGLEPVQTVSTLPERQAVAAGVTTADIQVHPSGRFLYGSNRGHDTIVVFAIDQETGRLTHVEHEPTGGSTPRAFGIDPAGRYLLAANQRSDSVVVFGIDSQSGRLSPTGHQARVGSPVCVKFLASRTP